MSENLRIKGRTVRTNGVGIPKLRIVIEDVEALLDNVWVAETRTDGVGAFDVTVPKSAFGLERPDVRVHVFDHVYRPLHTTGTHEDLDLDSLNLGSIEIADEVWGGWVATGTAGVPAFPVVQSEVMPLVDNELAWGDLYGDVEAAQSRVFANLFYFDLKGDSDDDGFTVMKFGPPTGANGQRELFRLEDCLESLATGGVPVRVLIRDAGEETVAAVSFVLGIAGLLLLAEGLEQGLDQVSSGDALWLSLAAVFFAGFAGVHLAEHYLPDTAEEVVTWGDRVRTALGAADADRLQVRKFHSGFTVPMHAKFVTIDGETAYTLGSPFLQEYFDGTGHLIDEPRRGAVPFPSAIGVPIHDVSLRLHGPVVADLDATFELLWNDEGPSLAPPAPASVQPGQDWPAVQVTRSLPGDRFADAAAGDTTILESYLRAIAQAEDYVYLENQYVTEPAILLALLHRLQENATVQVILLLNNKLDIPLYGWWQPEALREFREALRAAGAEDRVGMYTLWSHEGASSPGGKTRLMRNYVHSKVAVVDDAWATVGSANLDGTSLRAAQHTVANVLGALNAIELDEVAREGVGEDRAVEVNVSIYSEQQNLRTQQTLPTSTVPHSLREALWAEHLGLDPAAFPSRPAGGWLELWNTRAKEKLQGLIDQPGVIHSSRVLVHQIGESDAKDYLKASGVDVETVTVEEKNKSFDLEAWQWDS